MATIILEGTHGTYAFNPDDKQNLVGEGGMGRVFKGIDKNTGKLVAIKVLFRELTNNPGNIERSKVESTIRLKHKNLIEMLDFIELGGIHHTVCEYLDGITLSDKIAALQANGQSLDSTEVKKISLAVSEGLAELHRNDLIHRDVKPSNILLLNDGGIKLFDYGVIKKSKEVIQKLTSTGAVIGTVHYASPEQIKNSGDETITSATDIYSLAITIYEMITGKVPFDGDSEYVIMEKQTNEPIPANSQLTKGYFNLLTNATAKHPKNRYKSIGEFMDDLLRLPNGKVVLLKSNWWKRKEFKISAIIILLLIIGLTAAVLLHQKHVNQMFTSYANDGNRYFSLAQYDSALVNYKKAQSYRPEDSVKHQINVLETLVPAMHSFYNAQYSAAYKQLKAAADLGSGDAEYYLGELTYNGMGTVKDYKKGWEFSNRAVKHRFKMAYWRIANAYENGKGVEKNTDKADEYYLEALAAMKTLAEAGDPEALGNLGGMYSSGSGVTRNSKIAFDYYLRSANKGYAFIQCNLAEMYYAGTGVDKDLGKALKWFTVSAAKGHPSSQHELGRLYIAGSSEIPQDVNKGLGLIRRAAAQNYSPALSYLGFIFFQGKYVLKNNDSSFVYTKLAVDYDNDNIVAIENMAYNYTNGLGTEKSYAEAKDYYARAIQLESRNTSDDLLKIAYLYYSGGYHLQQSDEKFVRFCELAEKYGNITGREQLGIYYNKKGIASFGNHQYTQARRYFKLALGKGNRSASNNLDYLARNGY